MSDNYSYNMGYNYLSRKGETTKDVYLTKMKSLETQDYENIDKIQCGKAEKVGRGQLQQRSGGGASPGECNSGGSWTLPRNSRGANVDSSRCGFECREKFVGEIYDGSSDVIIGERRTTAAGILEGCGEVSSTGSYHQSGTKYGESNVGRCRTLPRNSKLNLQEIEGCSSVPLVDDIAKSEKSMDNIQWEFRELISLSASHSLYYHDGSVDCENAAHEGKLPVDSNVDTISAFKSRKSIDVGGGEKRDADTFDGLPILQGLENVNDKLNIERTSNSGFGFCGEVRDENEKIGRFPLVDDIEMVQVAKEDASRLKMCVKLTSPTVNKKLANGSLLNLPLDPEKGKQEIAEKSGRRDRGNDVDFRQWLTVCGLLVIAAALGVGVGVPLALELRSSKLLEARLNVVKRLLKEQPLIDGHNDLPWNLRKFLHNKLKDFRFSENLRLKDQWSGNTWSHTDLVRLRQGLVGAQFWSVYVPCGAQHLNAVQLALEQIDVIRRLIKKYPAQMQLVDSSEGIMEAHQNGKLASLIGLEGGHLLGNSLSVLRMYYQLGVRYVTLTHTCSTPWADSLPANGANQKATEEGISEKGGLSKFGKKLIFEMNRLGMMVDLSHVSTKTMEDALETTKAPIIFSHSSAHALCNSSRNVPDHILQQLSINGGVVMVSFLNRLLSCSKQATIHDVIDHINHIRSVAGVHHVGFGAGYDGINETPDQLEDVSRYPLLLAELGRDRKWSSSDIKKLAGANLLRVFREVEKISSDMTEPPSEEFIPSEDLEQRVSCRYSGS